MNYHSLRVLYHKELQGYFRGPVAYTYLVVFLFAIGQLSFEAGLGGFFYLRYSSLDAFFKYIPWMFLFLIPTMSMSLWSKERSSGTIEFLLTQPISLYEAVLAKFLASLSFVTLALIATFPMPITVSYLGNPDYGAILMGYLASFLMAGSLLSVACFASAISKNQVLSFVLTVLISSFFLMAGSPSVLDFISSFLPQYGVNLLGSLSVLNHFDSMKRGVLTLSDLWFFGILTGTFLIANIQVLTENKAS